MWRVPGKRLDSKNITSTPNHISGSVMIWACFSYQGVGHLEFGEKIIDSVKYTEILSRNIFATAR